MGQDVYMTYCQFSARSDLIQQAIDRGENAISVPLIITKTKYSPQRGLTDLSTTDPDHWLNKRVSDYYGIKEITGYLPEYST